MRPNNGLVVTDAELSGDYRMRELKPVVCRKCRREVARSDGEQIYFGAKPVPMNPRYVKFLCPSCFAEIKWRAESTLPKPQPVV